MSTNSDNQRIVDSIVKLIEEKESALLSEFSFDEYGSLEDIQEYDLDELDIDDKKRYKDLSEFKAVALTVRELVVAKATVTDNKELHRIKKDLERAIHDLRAMKEQKNEEANRAKVISTSIEDLISACKD